MEFKDYELYQSTDLQLKEMYEKWRQGLCEELLGDKFSNPYYISTPKDWHKANLKILLVGQEGHGKFGCGKDRGWTNADIELIQQYNREYLHVQWNSIKNCPKWEYNKSFFWKTFRDIKKNSSSENLISCAWSNIDKIHKLGYGGKNCALSDELRNKLHNNEINVLVEEIKILQPDIVALLGTHYLSLDKVFNNRQKVENCWAQGKEKMFVEKLEYKLTNGETKQTKLIIRYFHPNAWKKYKGEDYEENFLNLIK